MSDNLITFDEVVKLAEAVVRERGEGYVYSHPTGGEGTCSNVHVNPEDGTVTPGCIVGTMAIRMFDIDPIELNTDYLVDAGADVFMATVLRDYSTDRPKISEKAQAFLRAIQTSQDRGVPWGVSLRNAKLGHSTLKNSMLNDTLGDEISKERMESGRYVKGETNGEDRTWVYVQMTSSSFLDYPDYRAENFDEYDS